MNKLSFKNFCEENDTFLDGKEKREFVLKLRKINKSQGAVKEALIKNLTTGTEVLVFIRGRRLCMSDTECGEKYEYLDRIIRSK